MEKTDNKSKTGKIIMQEENSFKIFLIKIWPTVYRIINGFLYFLLTVIRSIVSIAINQIKKGGGV